MNEKTEVHGRLTHGPSPDSIIEKTLQFVYQQLPAWRDKPHRERTDSEEALNGQLCKHLNAAARREAFSMAHFHHEERQQNRRRVDLSAQPYDETVIEGRTFHDDEAFLVLEAKRLPADRNSREREYVIGERESGGIQRFKLGLHGSALAHAAMIAYIQNSTSQKWFEQLNRWIDELTKSDSASWVDTDLLHSFAEEKALRVARCESQHDRIGSSTPSVKLSHLWVEMRDVADG